MTNAEIREWFTPAEDCVPNRHAVITYETDCWCVLVEEYIVSTKTPRKIVHSAHGYGSTVWEALVNAIAEWGRTRCGAI